MMAYVPRDIVPRTIADFAAGEGGLLENARRLWPDVQVLANDICRKSVRRLERRFPDWKVSCTDFFNRASRRSAKYSVYRGKIDVILLNPPFSQRGGRLWEWVVDDKIVHSGRALAFVSHALEFLSDRGCLLAVLPQSCLVSERDELGWTILKSEHSIEILAEFDRFAFKSARASTYLVRICRLGERMREANTDSSVRCSGKDASRIVRGKYQMHWLENDEVGRFPLVHTSNLQGGALTLDECQLCSGKTSLKGPAVLFPRVGKITPNKIAVIGCTTEFVLSDCVFGIPCENEEEAERIRERIFASWKQFESIFRGTGAPYTTLRRVKSVMEDIGLFSKRISQ